MVKDKGLARFERKREVFKKYTGSLEYIGNIGNRFLERGN